MPAVELVPMNVGCVGSGGGRRHVRPNRARSAAVPPRKSRRSAWAARSESRREVGPGAWSVGRAVVLSAGSSSEVRACQRDRCAANEGADLRCVSHTHSGREVTQCAHCLP